MGYSRSQFYEVKRAFQTGGLQDLLDKPIVDTYSPPAFAKFYTAKLAVTAADIAYDRVLPFYEAEGLFVEVILTDKGNEYVGS